MDLEGTEEAIVPANQEPGADSEVDSAYEGDVQSETTSLRSSVASHRFENGRRYGDYKEHWAPNDDIQSDQLDIGHHIYLLMMEGQLALAPIEKDPAMVLDIGTGTGIWAIDFADENPGSTVIGTDVTPIQPSWTPPNCKFEIDDCTLPWTFQENSFDYIHIRGLYGSVADWPELYGRIYAHLKPGGWFEQSEASPDVMTDDDSIPADNILRKANVLYLEAGEKMGRTFRIWQLQKDYIDKAGFVDTHEVKFKMPLGPWPADKKLKEIGRWHLLESYQGIEGWTMFLLMKLHGWSLEEYQVFLAKVKAAFGDRKIHSYTSGSVVYGRKPLESEAPA